MEAYRIAFIGAGGIARIHAFALAALPYYYDSVPELVQKAVISARPESRQRFADKYGFAETLQMDALVSRDDINTVFILSPNELHATHLEQTLEMKNIRCVYIEKPICAAKPEEEQVAGLEKNLSTSVHVQAGFQFLQMSNVRRALRLWKEEDFGTPIHFQARYLHSGYLDSGYRKKRRSRLKPIPGGGAMADLGSHALSFLVAFLGEHLDVMAAEQSGNFDDVPTASDLCTTVLIRDGKSGAKGTVVASRISAGAGDQLELEIMCTKCSIRLSTLRPDVLEFYPGKGSGEWQTLYCGNDFLPVTQFPARSVPAGWLRSLIHAHYLFFGGADASAVIPDLKHGLTVQRLVRQTAERLMETRKSST